MIPVKICGLTRLEDAREAIQYGAQALGFVFAPSKRQVDAATVRAITGQLSPLVTKIGVFVNEDPWRIRELMMECRLDLAQLHGEETPDDCEVLAGRVIKAFKAGKDQPALHWKQAPIRGILLDTYSPAVAGGTGETFDWNLVADYRVLEKPIILAGGLNAANVGMAIRSANLDGLDISSGVEQQPGVKDPAKLRQLMETVREVR